MKKTGKLTINREKLRELIDTNLERVHGGYPQSAGSDWCSSQAALKCSYGCKGDMTAICANR